jgi:hypothetical protein
METEIAESDAKKAAAEAALANGPARLRNAEHNP